MKNNTRKLLRNFLIEMVVYGLLVVGYFIVVLRVIGDWLNTLFHTDLAVYAFVALGLIVAQAVVLEMVTTFLIERLGLERLE